MKLYSFIRILIALAFSAALTSCALAEEAQNKTKAVSGGVLIKADTPAVSAEWLAKAKADYPLDSCPVSADKLDGGDMGPPLDFVYRQDGKPDRLVRLCCNHCVKDVKKDPAKILKIIDDAAAAKAKAAPVK